MTLNDQKAQFSVSFLHAGATVIGVKLAHWTVDDDTIDATLGQTGGGGTVRSPKLDVQLKCSSDHSVLKTDGVHFKLKRKNYDDLRDPARHTDIILVVLLVPERADEWMTWEPETRWYSCRAAWWANFSGADVRAGVDEPTVILPRKQHFHSASLSSIFDRLGRGENP